MQTANILTLFRIICAVVMLFFPVPSAAFFCFYILCGLTDMIDGPIARKTGSESELGAKLDSIADIVFIVAALIKLLPVYDVKPWLWGLIILIGLVKAFGYICIYYKLKRFVFPHTLPDKLAGAFLFALPLSVLLIPFDICAAVCCAVAFAAALHEAYLSLSLTTKK